MKKNEKFFSLMCSFRCRLKIWKKMRSIILILILVANLFGERNYFGKEFIFAIPENESVQVNDASHNNLRIELNISAREDALVKLFRKDKQILLREIFIPAHSSESIILEDFVENEINKNDLNEQSYMLEKCYQIESNGDISANLINYFEYSSEATTLLPTTSWGKKYFHNSYWNDLNNRNNRNTGFLILSKEDDTEINIKLNGRAENNNYSINGINKLGDELNIELDKNMVYLIEAEGIFGRTIDISGSEITGNKEIAVISFHQRTGIPSNFNTGEDYLLEMFPSSEAWSKEYFTLEFDRNGGGDFFRIIASEDDTEIKIKNYDKSSLQLLNEFDFELDKGEFADNNPDQNGISGFVHWKSNKPILVVQYSYSEEFDGSENHDPTMVYAISPDQLTKEVVTKTPLQNIFPNNKINLFVRDLNDDILDLQSVEYNGKPIYLIDEGFLERKVPGTNCYFTTLEVSNLQTTKITGDAPFGAVLYGSREFDSYAMLVGGNFDVLNKVDTIPPAISISRYCTEFYINSNEIDLVENGIDTIYNYQSGVAEILIQSLDNMFFDRDENILSVIDVKLPAFAEILALDSVGNIKEEVIEFSPIEEKIVLKMTTDKQKYKPGEILNLKIELDHLEKQKLDSLFIKIRYPSRSMALIDKEIIQKNSQSDEFTELNLIIENSIDSIIELNFKTLIWEENQFDIEFDLDYNHKCIALAPEFLKIDYTDCLYDYRAVSTSGFENGIRLSNGVTEIDLIIESAFEQSAIIEIFNLDGVRVYHNNVNLNEGENSFKIEKEYLEKGLFFIKVDGEIISISKKFIN